MINKYLDANVNPAQILQTKFTTFTIVNMLNTFIKLTKS